MDEEEPVIDPFTSPDDISDVIFIVEEKQIFAHRSILGKIFPFFSFLAFCMVYSSESLTGIQSNVILQWFS